MTLPEAFKTLGLDPGASAADAQRAFRTLAAQAHPDGGASAEAAGELIAKLDEARNVILAADGQLPALGAVTDLVLAQTQVLERWEKRQEASARADAMERTMIQRETSGLLLRKRQAQQAVAICGGLAALSAFFRSVAVPPFNEGSAFIGTVLAVLGVTIAIAGLLAWISSQESRKAEALVEDAIEMLSDRPSCLAILNEIEATADSRSPWTSSQLDQALDQWSSASRATSGTVAALARAVGTGDFRRLLATKAGVHGLLEDRITVADGERRSVYVRLFPET